MNTLSTVSIFALFTTAGFVSGCSSPTEVDQILLIPEAIQVQAHVDCQAAHNFYAPEAIHLSRMSRNRALATMVGTETASSGFADEVNQCARHKLLSNRAGSVIDVQSHQVVLSDAKTTLRSALRTAPQQIAPDNCAVGGSILQGGTTICPGY